uniref:Uncharacterized protein n=1 Tax=Anguilla anguilla TaxID=7936 RepID=A0A0E9S327_ANGAN
MSSLSKMFLSTLFRMFTSAVSIFCQFRQMKYQKQSNK